MQSFLSNLTVDGENKKLSQVGNNVACQGFFILFKRLQEAYWHFLGCYTKAKKEEFGGMFTFCAIGMSVFEVSDSVALFVVIKRYPHLVPSEFNWRREYLRWEEYNATCLIVGAYILSEDYTHLLLVKGFHKPFWVCPSGKLEPNEDFREGAIREIREEVGMNISRRQMKEWLFYESEYKGRRFRGYILEGFKKDLQFKPGIPFEIEVSFICFGLLKKH